MFIQFEKSPFINSYYYKVKKSVSEVATAFEMWIFKHLLGVFNVMYN